MSSAQPGTPTSGADQCVEDLHILGEESSDDEELGTNSPTTPGQGTLDPQDQSYASTSTPRRRPAAPNQPYSPLSEHHSSGSQVDLNALFDARLKATEEEVRRIDFIVDFVRWISRSDFLRLQQPEPIVGGPSTNYPAAVEEHGIKGQSVYTVLFHHLDMRAFACKLCSHKVEDDLEAAIAHERTEHFGHYPYRCSTTQTQCSQRFASQAELEGHQFDTGH